ncbi:LytR family transcriptional attenuator [Scopulibacillus darangshiensis]|uniref:LytR family transcriptional attenuator n=1 Tax=Scopulibacillus darangshiensis TaxID=442528 RepID=A0A4R2NLD1_9BACL|nr:LCP family protein [Scopulibacillus darangshiensis]TCP22350.1 LytR family transcriptional attenuator [Scopulibacillus darangshiensis]
MESRVDGRRKKKKKKWRKRLLLILLVIILVLVGYGVYVFVETKAALNQSQIDIGRKGDKSELRKDGVTLGKDPISILLLGVETYATKGKSGRADTEIVITMDPDTKDLTMVSVPRDTRVSIDNAGQYTGIHKINSAYYYGGITDYGPVKLQVETVEGLLDIPIDKFVAVGFDGFRDIVDALGGVDIDIKKGFWEKNIYNHNKRIYFKKGEAHLNGEEALAFVRMRKRAVNATYSRDERQRQFLKATINQAVSAGTIFKVGQITDILGEHVKTNLTASEIYALEKRFSTINKSSIKTIKIAGQDKVIGQTSYYIADRDSLEEVSQKLRRSLGLKPDSQFTTNADTVGQ